MAFLKLAVSFFMTVLFFGLLIVCIIHPEVSAVIIIGVVFILLWLATFELLDYFGG